MKRSPLVAISLLGNFYFRLWWTWFRFHFGFQEIKVNLAKHLDQPQSGKEIPDLRRYLIAFQRAKRLSLAPSNCLRECYCLFEVLKARGMTPTFRIGVKKEIDLKAHAWLEWGDKALYSDASDFRPLEKT